MSEHQKLRPPPKKAVSCAIYTRKSTEEGLEQEFNSLDAQREAAEAYIRSQQHEGWQPSPVRYDDGGFTGGNMDRPALTRLMDDIAAGAVQCVVVYKVDRLSRSLLDFARMMATFEKHQVAFVSVTQQFNTATSMGRLVLNVLLSFAQFEREIISERTRDKIAATRRKGKWCGGRPILGYDIDRASTRLVVNKGEAERVREIFRMYLERDALFPVLQELARRGWRNKAWTTRKGVDRGGLLFTKSSLHSLLTNVLYVGRISYKTEVHPAVHAPIIDAASWQAVQEKLSDNNQSGRLRRRNRYGALLLGLLRCRTCNCAMSPTTSKRADRVYRYYTCAKAQHNGRSTCPAPSLPAHEIERYILEQIAVLSADDLAPEAAEMLDAWRPQMSKQPPQEQARLIRAFLERIEHDGLRGTVAMSFRPEALKSVEPQSSPPEAS